MASLRNNPKWLFVGRALTEAKTLNAITTLFFLARGVTLGEVFTLSLVFSLTSLVAEIPTGYLADRFGRKRTMLLGVVLLIAANIFAFFAHGFFEFSFFFALLALASSCFSGTEEALLYDTLKETKQESKMTAYNGKLFASRSILKMILPPLCAIIASDLADWQFHIVIGIDILASLGAFWCFTQLVEPTHRLRVLNREFDILRQSIDTIRNHPFLFRASMNKTLLFIGGVIYWKAYQPVLTNHGISVAWLGAFYVFLHGSAFLIRYFAGAIEKRVGAVPLLFWTGAISLVPATIFIFTDVAWILFVSILLTIIINAARDPFFADTMNKRIASESRATTLSNLNVVKGILDIPILLICSAVATANPKSPILVAMVISIIGLSIFPIRKRDVA